MTVMNMRSIAGSLNTQWIILLTARIGTYNRRGESVGLSEEPQPSRVAADVQTATGKVLLLVPEGERTREHVAIIFTRDITTVREALGAEASRVVYKGTKWKCVAIPDDCVENGFITALFQNTKEAYTA